MLTQVSAVGFLGVMLAATAISAGDDTRYPIKLDRPVRMGDVYDVRHLVEASGTSVMTFGTRPPETHPNAPLEGELSGHCAVTAVDAQGNATGLSITIQKFIVNTKEAFPAGSLLDITWGPNIVTFKANGKDVSGQPASVLRLLYTPIRNAELGEDAAYGSTMPRKIGESWPVNTEAVAKMKSFDGNKVDPKKVIGETTLKSVERIGNTDALRVVTKFSMTDFDNPADLPSTVSVDASERTYEMTRLLPFEDTLPPLEVDLVVDSRQTEHTKPPADPAAKSYTQHIHLRSYVTTPAVAPRK